LNGSGVGHRIEMRVNGESRSADVEARLLASDFLRQTLGLTGTHVGCEHGVCGACTVLVDGEAVRSCLLFAVQLEGCDVQTVESLAGAAGGPLHPIQQAFHDSHALQCGFCTPGILMSLVPWLDRNPRPSVEEAREALGGNLCRCTGYTKIVEAVLEAASRLAAEDGG